MDSIILALNTKELDFDDKLGKKKKKNSFGDISSFHQQMKDH